MMRKIDIEKISTEVARRYLEGTLINGIPREIYRGVHKHQTVFYAGIEEVAPGVGEIWVKYALPANEYPGAWMAIKDLFMVRWDLGHYHRIQSHVLENSVSVGFNKHLGMEVEGTMKKFIDKDNYLIMARVK